MGYRVDVTQAGAYTAPPPSSKIARAPEQLILLDCVVTHPQGMADEPEPIILNLRSASERE